MTRSLRRAVLTFAVSAALGSAQAAEEATDPAAQNQPETGGERYCSSTAFTQFLACRNEVVDDQLTAQAFCINVSDDEEREACFDDAADSRAEEWQACNAQHEARRDLCRVFGQGRYDPGFSPELFDDDFATPARPNPYLPLAIGNRWEYAGGLIDSEDPTSETFTDEVLDETKLIEGVTCIVSRNTAYEDGELIELTDDWYARTFEGDIVYCGEQVQNFESFEGDDPAQPELVDLDGSFKAGRQAMSGLLFPGDPSIGRIYRQEWAPGDAEDVGEVVSTTYGYGAGAELDGHMDSDLADLLCDDDCVVTRDFSPFDPGTFALKYYARGIGMFYEVETTAEGEVEVFRLTGCNVDPRCDALPRPEE